MSSSFIAGLEVVFVFGCVLGLAVFELWRLRRETRKPPTVTEAETRTGGDRSP